MNKSGKIGLTAAALMACTAGAASAGTIIAATRTSTGIKPFAATQTFPAFGALVAAGEVPAGSVLTGVKDTLTDILAGSVSGHNTGLGSGVFTLAAQDNASKTIAGVLTVDTMTVGNIVSSTLAGGDSFSDPSTGTSSASVTSASATVLAAFAGTGTVSAALTDLIVTHGSFSFSGSVSSTGTGKAVDVLSYSFATTLPIPEPATRSLLGAGLVGIGIAGRRKRQAKAQV